MTHDPMTADQFRWFLVLVTGGVSALWFLSDAVKLWKSGRADGSDPSVRDRRFGYTMGLVIAVIGMVGSAKLEGWISWGTSAVAVAQPPAPAMKFDPTEVRHVLQDLAGGQVFVLSTSQPFDYATVAKTAAAIDPDVRTAEPFVYADVIVHHDTLAIAAVMKGVSPTRFKNNVEKYFIEGTLPVDTADPRIAIGKGLATLLGVHVGDRVELEVPPAAPRAVQISAIHDTQFPEYEFHLVVTNLPTAQALIGKADAATGIELELGHEDQAQRIAKALGAKLGDSYKVFDWCELNQKFLGCTWQ